MNNKTARLIKQFSTLLNRPYRNGKKLWNQLPRPTRNSVRKHMEGFLNPPKFEDQKK